MFTPASIFFARNLYSKTRQFTGKHPIHFHCQLKRLSPLCAADREHPATNWKSTSLWNKTSSALVLFFQPFAQILALSEQLIPKHKGSLLKWF